MHTLNYIDLARATVDERHRRISPHARVLQTNHNSGHKARQWAGRKLIRLGERLTPQPNELQLKVSTGPPGT